MTFWVLQNWTWMVKWLEVPKCISVLDGKTNWNILLLGLLLPEGLPVADLVSMGLGKGLLSQNGSFTTMIAHQSTIFHILYYSSQNLLLLHPCFWISEFSWQSKILVLCCISYSLLCCFYYKAQQAFEFTLWNAVMNLCSHGETKLWHYVVGLLGAGDARSFS